jgi:hypothetical protein
LTIPITACIPLYQISEDVFDGIAASFLDVFPQTTLWRGDFSAGEPAVALIGHTSPDAFDAARADARSRALMVNPDRGNPYLSGRSLKNRFDTIRSAPLTGTAAASLRAERIEWRERGAEIWAASLLCFEGDNAAADRLALGAIARLRTEIQTAVLGGSRK